MASSASPPSLFVTVPMQPRYEEASTNPDYAGTFMTRADKEALAREISGEKRALAACLDHADLTQPSDLVPYDKQIGYWRDAWVDKDDNLWMLSEMDGKLDTVKRIEQTFKEKTLDWGGSLFCRIVKDQETARVIKIDPTHGGFTTDPNLGKLGIGSWAYQVATDPRAMARVLRERHLTQEGAYVPDETRARWLGEATATPTFRPKWKWPVDAPLSSVIKKKEAAAGEADSQSKPLLPFHQKTTSATEMVTRATNDATTQSPFSVFSQSRPRFTPTTTMADQQQAAAPSPATLPVPAPEKPASAPAPAQTPALTPKAPEPGLVTANENKLFIEAVKRILDESVTGPSLGERLTDAQRLLEDKTRLARLDPYDPDSGDAYYTKRKELKEFVEAQQKQRKQVLARMADQGLLHQGHVQALHALKELPEESEASRAATRIVGEFVTAATADSARAQLQIEKQNQLEQKLRKEIADKEKAAADKERAMQEEIATLKRARDEKDEEVRASKKRYDELETVSRKAAAPAPATEPAAAPAPAPASKTAEGVTAATSSSTSSSAAKLLDATSSSSASTSGAANSRQFKEFLMQRFSGGVGRVMPTGFADRTSYEKPYEPYNSSKSVADAYQDFRSGYAGRAF